MKAPRFKILFAVLIFMAAIMSCDLASKVTPPATTYPMDGSWTISLTGGTYDGQTASCTIKFASESGGVQAYIGNGSFAGLTQYSSVTVADVSGYTKFVFDDNDSNTGNVVCQGTRTDNTVNNGSYTVYDATGATITFGTFTATKQ